MILILRWLVGLAPDTQEQHLTGEKDTAEAATTKTDDPPDAEENPALLEAEVIYEKLMDGTMSAVEVCMSDVLKTINDLVGRYKESQKASSRTSALWVQYMDMVDILRKYIRAERTGNWSLHLHAIQEMLPYLAVSGHNLYTKSAKVYLRQMSNLQAELNNALKHFEEGLHVVRRSYHLWAGLSSDLIIEQVLIAKPENQRGPHERERNDGATASAVAAIHACLCGIQQGNARANRVSYTAKARQARDWRDTLAAVQYSQERNPFSPDPTLRNIAIGVHAHTPVNVDTAKNVGTTILQSMEVKRAAEYTFKKKDQAVTLHMKS